MKLFKKCICCLLFLSQYCLSLPLRDPEEAKPLAPIAIKKKVASLNQN